MQILHKLYLKYSTVKNQRKEVRRQEQANHLLKLQRRLVRSQLVPPRYQHHLPVLFSDSWLPFVQIITMIFYLEYVQWTCLHCLLGEEIALSLCPTWLTPYYETLLHGSTYNHLEKCSTIHSVICHCYVPSTFCVHQIISHSVQLNARRWLDFTVRCKK